MIPSKIAQQKVAARPGKIPTNMAAQKAVAQKAAPRAAQMAAQKQVARNAALAAPRAFKKGGQVKKKK